MSYYDPCLVFFSLSLQVFEFLFQNKYTADEDVDLEEVLIKKNSSQFTTPKKNIVSYPPHTPPHPTKAKNLCHPEDRASRLMRRN